MHAVDTSARDRTVQTETQPEGNEHELVAVTETLPGNEPTDATIQLSTGTTYRTRYWRCRNCGQERNQHSDFTEPCPTPDPASPVTDGGYSLDDPRTRRALTEDMTIQFTDRGPEYVVESASGNTYELDLEAETCTCPDHEQRDVECKHLRRVAIDIQAGLVPAPDGTLNR